MRKTINGRATTYLKAVFILLTILTNSVAPCALCSCATLTQTSSSPHLITYTMGKPQHFDVNFFFSSDVSPCGMTYEFKDSNTVWTSGLYSLTARSGYPDSVLINYPDQVWDSSTKTPQTFTYTAKLTENPTIPISVSVEITFVRDCTSTGVDFTL